jgi:sugar/nucleoside kinase (ribokinase family)
MASLLVTGSIALDTVETTSNRMDNQLGGSAVYFSMAGAHLNPVRLVGAVGDDFPAEHTALLNKYNIDTRGLEIRKGSKTFRWHGKYSQDMNNRDTISLALNILAEHGPKIPAAFADSEYVFLANNAPTLQMDLLDQLTKPKFVICDTMDFYINNFLADLKKLLTRVDGIVLNDSEARLITGEHNLITAAFAVSHLGPKMVIVKKGEHGAMMVHNGKLFLLPAYPTEKVVDPTGAGDSFAGGFMGYLASVDKTDFNALANALVYGTIIASFTVESFSMKSLLTADKRSIDHRRNEFLEMIGTKLTRA